MFHPFSLIITGLVLLPNLGFFLKKPGNSASPQAKEPVVLVILERIGQAGCFIGPVFFRIRIDGPADIAALAGMVITLGVYWYCWIRFFKGNGTDELLYAPLLSIPVPLAVSPVLYFLLSSVILDSLPMLIAALLLAAGHIPISLIQYKAIRNG